jgi:hypothetical protein
LAYFSLPSYGQKGSPKLASIPLLLVEQSKEHDLDVLAAKQQRSQTYRTRLSQLYLLLSCPFTALSDECVEVNLIQRFGIENENAVLFSQSSFRRRIGVFEAANFLNQRLNNELLWRDALT